MKATLDLDWPEGGVCMTVAPAGKPGWYLMTTVVDGTMVESTMLLNPEMAQMLIVFLSMDQNEGLFADD